MDILKRKLNEIEKNLTNNNENFFTPNLKIVKNKTTYQKTTKNPSPPRNNETSKKNTYNPSPSPYSKYEKF